MKRKTKMLAGLMTCMLMMTACTGGQSTNQAAQEKEKGLQSVQVVLDWYPNAMHAFLYNAIEKGYYAEEGLDVQLVFPSNENDALSMVAAGKADIGMYYPMYVIEARAEQNIPVRSIGAVCQQQLNVVVSRKDKNIKSPADFVGKNIGYGGSALTEALAKTMMRNVGVDPATVTMTNVGMDLMSAMTTDRVDATIGCMLNHEVPQLIEQGFEVNAFHMYEYGVPSDYELVFVANEDAVDNRSEQLKAFLRASKKGFADMRADPEGSLQLLLQNQNAENFPLSESVERQSMEILLPVMEKEDAPFLSQDPAVWQNDIDWMTENGLITNAIQAEDVMVDFGV